MGVEPLDIIIRVTASGRQVFQELDDDLGQMDSKSSGLTSTLIGVGVAAAALAMTLTTAFVAAVRESMMATMEWGGELDTLGDMFGMTGEKASTYAAAAHHVGLSVGEMSMGLNYLVKNLDDVGRGHKAATTTIVDQSDKVRDLKEKLADEQEHLKRVTKTLQEAKQPTDAMRYAVEDAQKAIARTNRDLAETPLKLVKVKEGADVLKPFEQALKTMGISATDSSGKLKTFDQIMPQIMDWFQKAPAGVNQTALAMDLFGLRGGSKFLDFLRMGSGGLKEFTEFARESGLLMSTQTVNAVEELGFAFNDLKMQVQGMWVTLGTALLPVFQELTEYMSENVIPVFATFVREHAHQIAQALINLGEWIGHVVATVVELWPKIQETIAAVWSVIKPILDLWLEYRSMIRDTEVGFAKALIELWPEIQKVLEEAWKVIQPILVDLLAWLKEMWPKIQEAAAQAWAVLEPILRQLLEFIGQLVERFGEFVDFVVTEVWPRVQAALEAAWAVIQPILQMVIGFVQRVMDTAGALMNFWCNEVWPRIAAVLQAVWGVVGPVLQEIFAMLSTFWNEISPKIIAALEAIWLRLEELWKEAQPFIELAIEIIEEMLGALLAFFEKHGQQILAVIENTWNVIYGFLEVILGTIVGIIEIFLDVISGDWEAVGEDIMRMTQRQMDGVEHIFRGAFGVIINIIQIWADELIVHIEQALNDLRRHFENQFNGIMDFLRGIAGAMANIGREIVQGLINGITGMGGQLSGALQGIVQSAVNAAKSALGIASPSKVFAEIGRNMAAGLTQGFGSGDMGLGKTLIGTVGSGSRGTSFKAMAGDNYFVYAPYIGVTETEFERWLQKYIEQGYIVMKKKLIGVG